MSFTAAVLRNRHAVWALALGTALFGTLAYLELPMQLFPDTAPPVVNVITQYPGAGADDVAQNLSEPLEQELASLEGIAEVRTTSRDNLSLIALEFQYDRDVDLAAVDVQNAIARVRDDLPAGIAEPQVLKLSTNDRPIVSLGVTARDLRAARVFAEEVVAPALRRTPGVAAVDVFGGAVDAVLIDVDPRRLAAYRVSLSQLVQTVRAHNATLPAGSLRTATSQLSLRMEARSGDLRELASIPINTPDGRLLLSDLAEVRRGTLDDDAVFAIDGHRSIAIQVFKTIDANTVDVVRDVLSEAERLESSHPSLDLAVGEESASFTEISISNLLDNVWQALILAALIIFAFIGRLRSSLVVTVSMPLSFGMTFGLMQLTGVELNMVTLSAIILAVGMVVDASVVVIENIARHREQGGASDAAASAASGTDEVRLAVLAGAATTIIVLVPLLFLRGFVGKTFGPLAQTLLYAFASSVVVALILVPVLSLHTARGGRLDRLGYRTTGPFRWLMDRVRDGYAGLLRLALGHRLLTIGVALALLGAGAGGIRARGMDMLPRMDGGSFFISLETPSGTSLYETEKVVRQIEATLAEEPEVVKVQSQAGFEPGMRSMSSGAFGPTQGFITVVLTERTSRDESIWSIEERVRQRIARIPGIRTATVRELGNTAKSTTAAPIVVRISGPDPLVLDHLGGEVLARAAEVPAVVEPVRSWRIDQPRYRVEIDQLRAGRLGLTPAAVAAQMQAGAVGTPAGDFYGDGSAVPIQVRYRRPANAGVGALLDYPIIDPSAEPVPLRAVASLEPVRGPAVLSSENFVPTLDITASTRGTALSFATRDVGAALDDMVVPDGYQVALAGENEDLGEARAQIGAALAIALAAVYLLLVAQLRSFSYPLTILLSVPLSVSGVGIALWLAGKSVSMPVMIAFVLLVGIVVNNAIILLDFVRQARRSGADRRDALIESVRARFRPIMMTSISTIAGMIPLASEWALGAERFSPLAIAVIGGMSAATLLTMVFIPVVYDLLDDLGQRLGRGRARRGLATLAIAGAVSAPGLARAEEPLRLDLDTAVQMASEHSYAVGAAGEQVGAAGARSKQARGLLLPRLDVTGRYSRLSEVEPGTLALPSTGGVQFGDSITDAWSARAAITQPIVDVERYRRFRAAEAAVDVARREAEVTGGDLRLEVEEAYFALLRLGALKGAVGSSVELLRAHTDRLRALEQEGRALPLDVARSETRLARVRVELAVLRGQEDVAATRLVTLVGAPPGTPLVLTESLDGGSGPLADTETLSGRALRDGDRGRVARSKVVVAERQRAAAAGGWWPRLSAQAGYTFANPNDRYVPPRSEFHGTWDLSLILQWNLDWGVTSGRVDEARHLEAAARLALSATDERTRLEVAQARARLVAAARVVEVAAGAAGTAREALEQATVLFDAGRLDSTELLERDADLARARADHIEARVDRRLAAAALRRVVGSNIEP